MTDKLIGANVLALKFKRRNNGLLLCNSKKCASPIANGARSAIEKVLHGCYETALVMNAPSLTYLAVRNTLYEVN